MISTNFFSENLSFDTLQVLHILLVLYILAPALSLCLLSIDSLAKSGIRERYVAFISKSASLIQLLVSLGVILCMALRKFQPVQCYAFHKLPLFLDWTAIVYMNLVGFIAWIVTAYSERYLHREPGYRRYFLCLMIFLFGMSLIILGGSIDILFTGWEIVGLASFLLVGFYIDRPKAGRHALRAFLTYRLCDLGLLIGAILTHVVYHSGLFEVIDGRHIGSLVAEGVTPSTLMFLSALVFLAAAGKSAQFPF